MKKIVVLISMITMFLCTACTEQDVYGKDYDMENPGENAGKSNRGDMEEVVELNCYVNSFECGYISYADELRNGQLLIATEEELTEAMKYECLTVVEEWYANNAIAVAFAKLQENYPIEEYAYLIEYRETTTGGYDIHANNVGIKEDRIGFLFDKNVYPSPEQLVTEAMGGFCHMAAIPKAQIEGKTFGNVARP